MSMQVISRGPLRRRRSSTARAATRSPGRRSARAMCSSRSGRWSIPSIPKDIEQVHALQDAIKVEQKSRGKIRGAELGSGQPEEGARRAAGACHDHTGLQQGLRHQGRSRPDPPSGRNRRRLGAATPTRTRPTSTSRRPGTTARPSTSSPSRTYRSTAFWSVSLYNAEGYYEKNPYDAYSINNITGKKSADGSIAIQFGGCDGKIPNCLPIMKGWNYTVRLYRPRDEILNGKWKFPEPQPVS